MPTTADSADKKLSIPEYFSLAFFSLQKLWRLSKLLVVLTILETLYNGVWPIIIAYLSGQLVSEVSKTLNGTASFGRAVFLLLVVAALNLTSYVVSSLRSYYFTMKRERIEIALKKDLLHARAHYPLDELELPETQERFNLAASGLSAIDWYTSSVFGVISSLISIFGIVGVVFATFPWLVLVLLPLPFVSSYLRIRELRRFRNIWGLAKSHRMRVYGVESIFERASSVLEVRLFNLTKTLLHLWAKESEKSILVRNSQERAYAIIDVCIRIFEAIVGVLADLWMLHRLFIGVIPIAVFEQTRSLVSSFISSLSTIAQSLSDITTDGFAVRDYRSFINSNRILTAELLSSKKRVFERVDLNDISYRYPTADQDALRHANFSIAKGERIAIVGRNGAGKTTLLRLLLGVYKPKEGTVRLNGEVVPSGVVLPGNASVLMQDFTLFDFLTIGESVGISDYPNYDSKKVESALKTVGLIDYVHSVGGINRNFGYVDDDGIKLSGGQNQRLALARALYSSSDLLILDEPTSMIDAKDEQEIISTIMESHHDRSVLIVSHKASTVKLADKIVVMKAGHICEIGTHKELYKKGTEYHAIFHKQIEAFKE